MPGHDIPGHDVPGHDIGTPLADKETPEKRSRVLSAIRLSFSFMQIITVLMRSSQYRHHTLGDLEWLVIPPLMSGQFSVAQKGASTPVAVALWASVSAEVDRRLSETLHLPIRLRPDEWRSGDILWLVDVVGDPLVVPKLRKQLVETVFKGREAKMRVRADNGNVRVQRISAAGS